MNVVSMSNRLNMKVSTLRFYLLLFSVASVFNSCLKDKSSERYAYFKPLYKTREEVKANISSHPSMQMQQPGKMVVRDHFLFVNEPDKGVHILDIRNFSNPLNIAFIDVPGCQDIAVRGQYLYADCYTDLITIDIANPAAARLVDYQTGVFPSRSYNAFNPDTSMVIVG